MFSPASTPPEPGGPPRLLETEWRRPTAPPPGSLVPKHKNAPAAAQETTIDGPTASCQCEEGDAKERRRAVTARVAPFVPQRVLRAFATGSLGDSSNCGRRGEGTLPRVGAGSRAPPRHIAAAVLLVDVSGFTWLSEQARRRASSDGAEHFVLALSAFFSAITRLTGAMGGDVDCFAGDALLVVFERLPEEEGADGEPHLLHAAQRALACARTIHQRLDGFRYGPGDPPLRLHSALSVGELRPPPGSSDRSPPNSSALRWHAATCRDASAIARRNSTANAGSAAYPQPHA